MAPTRTAVCALTVDFALTYFLVSGEMERSNCPVNLLISDASGMSVLTAWAAGKFSASTIKKFFDENDINNKIKSRTPDHPRQGCRDEGRDSGEAPRLARGGRPPRRPSCCPNS